MALAGDGAVAISHDITASGRDNFYAWHGNEHMLERVSAAERHAARRIEREVSPREAASCCMRATRRLRRGVSA